MADIKFSEAPPADTLDGSEYLGATQDQQGTLRDVHITPAQIKALVERQTMSATELTIGATGAFGTLADAVSYLQNIRDAETVDVTANATQKFSNKATLSVTAGDFASIALGTLLRVYNNANSAFVCYGYKSTADEITALAPELEPETSFPAVVDVYVHEHYYFVMGASEEHAVTGTLNMPIGVSMISSNEGEYYNIKGDTNPVFTVSPTEQNMFICRNARNAVESGNTLFGCDASYYIHFDQCIHRGLWSANNAIIWLQTRCICDTGLDGIIHPGGLFVEFSENTIIAENVGNDFPFLEGIPLRIGGGGPSSTVRRQYTIRNNKVTMHKNIQTVNFDPWVFELTEGNANFNCTADVRDNEIEIQVHAPAATVTKFSLLKINAGGGRYDLVARDNAVTVVDNATSTSLEVNSDAGIGASSSVYLKGSSALPSSLLPVKLINALLLPDESV